MGGICSVLFDILRAGVTNAQNPPKLSNRIFLRFLGTVRPLVIRTDTRFAWTSNFATTGYFVIARKNGLDPEKRRLN
jgi:hypothetical protein